MKYSLLAPLAIALAGCDVTASNEPASVVITLTAANANSSCVNASPDPATIRAGQSVAFRNSTSAMQIVIGQGLDQPWTSIEPGETSGAIEFSLASTKKYYVQACGDASADLHTIVVTVN